MRDSDHWKEKYLASLDDIEAREKGWEALETVLRQSLSRLSLAVETSDRQLVAQLEALRHAVRQQATADQIGQLMGEISNSILRLDQQRAGGHDDTLARLARDLDALQVPDGLRQETRALKRQLREATQADDLRQALDAYAGYLRQTLSWFQETQSEDREGGLLDRLFGRRNPEAIGENPSASVSALDPPATDESAARMSAGEDDADAPPSFNQVLFELIHRLDLPAAMAEAQQRVTALLREPPSVDSARQAVVATADLMARTRLQVEQEKKDMESFLSQLTERLAELDRYLEDSVGYREQTAEQGGAIDARMSAEVAEIRRSVNEAEDIRQLKHAIQVRLTNIQLHMDARRRLEEDRLRQAEKEITHLKEALSEVQDESSDLRARLSEARDRALHDALTGLKNRLAYDERMSQECERWERYGRPTVLSIWDVDHFKRINDQYGHKVGDNVLKILGGLLSQHTRKSDFIARFGGEEFMLLLPETGIQTAFEVAEKLRRLIAASKFLYHGQSIPVSMSCGLAAFIAGDTPDSIYQRADAALYAAKQAGRNCCKLDPVSASPVEPDG